MLEDNYEYVIMIEGIEYKSISDYLKSNNNKKLAYKIKFSNHIFLEKLLLTPKKDISNDLLNEIRDELKMEYSILLEKQYKYQYVFVGQEVKEDILNYDYILCRREIYNIKKFMEPNIYEEVYHLPYKNDYIKLFIRDDIEVLISKGRSLTILSDKLIDNVGDITSSLF